MQRRQALQTVVSTALLGVAGCVDGSGSGTPAGSDDASSTATDEETVSDTEESGHTTEPTATPRDRLTLVEVDAGVAEADEAVVVAFETLQTKAQEAVEKALENDGHLEYTTGHYSDTTGVDVLYEHIEERWADSGEAYERTYLQYDGAYYGITLVKDGDWIAVDSAP